MSSIDLERVVFLENVDKPLNVNGASPGMDKVFDADPKMGRNAYRLSLEGPWVRVTDSQSGESEHVPVHMVKQMRHMRESTRARLSAKPELKRVIA